MREPENTYATDVATRDDTRSADKGSTNVRYDGTVKVRHNHYIKLPRLGDKLHRAVQDRYEYLKTDQKNL